MFLPCDQSVLKLLCTGVGAGVDAVVGAGASASAGASAGAGAGASAGTKFASSNPARSSLLNAPVCNVG